MKEDVIWKYLIQICVGLHHLHANKILHRDLKAINIFLTQEDDIRIGDLGVAKLITDPEAFAMTIIGTPYYLSPELCEERPYNQKSDIWALGCVLYELCTCKHPFKAANQGALALKIIRGKYDPLPNTYSRELKSLIRYCLTTDFRKRPSAQQILQMKSK